MALLDLRRPPLLPHDSLSEAACDSEGRVKRLYCIDNRGLEWLLNDGQRYLVRRLPLGTVQLSNGLVVSADRFSERDEP